ncbi:unnamed protein product [Caretta caretta]
MTACKFITLLRYPRIGNWPEGKIWGRLGIWLHLPLNLSTVGCGDLNGNANPQTLDSSLRGTAFSSSKVSRPGFIRIQSSTYQSLASCEI